jgi:cytochrome c biogenesis protein CcmG, thiol:disulfide interchange protein DsbE
MPERPGEDFDVDGIGSRSIGRVALEWGRNLALTAGLFAAMFLANAWIRAPDLPEVAPPFTLRDLDGRQVSLADFRGRTVVLNFWATWCGPCRAEAPTFSSFAEDHPEVTVLGIVADGPPAKVRGTATSIGMTFPILMGDPETLAAYDVGLFPTTVVVAPDGSVRSATGGMMVRPQLAWAAGVWW